MLFFDFLIMIMNLRKNVIYFKYIATACLALFLVGCSLPQEKPITTTTGSTNTAPSIILVDVNSQTLSLYENGKASKHYKISTSKFGIGNRQDSYQTPLGKHYVAHKIGDNAPLGTVFKSRIKTGEIAKINQEREEDVVTSRILWLRGLEDGINRGTGIDSFERYIYIHGTADEANIGKPASFGCIRMKNKEVIELFERVAEGKNGTIVYITDNPPKIAKELGITLAKLG